MIGNRLLQLVVAGLMIATSSTALCWSGSVSGTLDFYQRQGNYCPSSANCTGARYTEASHFGQYLPVQDAKVYVINQIGGVSGQGTTDANGNFNFNWNDGLLQNTIRTLVWRYEHKNGRFKIVGMSGQTLQFAGPAWNNGSSLNLGTITVGSSTSPHALANVFDGARMMWVHSLNTSSVMQTYFTNVEIRAFEPPGCLDSGGNPIPLCCNSSCADGPNKRIRLDAASMYAPQHRVMHEMGHIASYLASPGQSFKPALAYCYGGEVSPCGWNPGSDATSAENGAPQFEEGIATHFANIALYASNAATPRQCLSTGACSSASANNLELSLGVSCGTDVNRHPVQVMRYLWDIYDNAADYTGETMSLAGSSSYSYMGGFGNNNSENGKNEPWNAALTLIVEADGRSGKDWQDVLLSYAGQNTSTQFTNNCSPVGD